MQVSATKPVCMASTATTGIRCLSERKNSEMPIKCKRHLLISLFLISIGTSITERPLRQKKINEAQSWMKLKIKSTERKVIYGGPLIRYTVPKRSGICVIIVRIAANR